MGVVIGDDPGAVVVRPAREAHRDARGDAEHPEHHGHGSGEVLAVPGFRPGDEVDERRALRARRRLVVGEAARLPEPRLEREYRLVRRLRPAGDALRDHVERPIALEVRVRRIVEERTQCAVAVARPERSGGGDRRARGTARSLADSAPALTPACAAPDPGRSSTRGSSPLRRRARSRGARPRRDGTPCRVGGPPGPSACPPPRGGRRPSPRRARAARPSSGDRPHGAGRDSEAEAPASRRRPARASRGPRTSDHA